MTLYSSDDRPLRVPAKEEVVGRATNGWRPPAAPGTRERDAVAQEAAEVEESSPPPAPVAFHAPAVLPPAAPTVTPVAASAAPAPAAPPPAAPFAAPAAAAPAVLTPAASAVSPVVAPATPAPAVLTPAAPAISPPAASAAPAPAVLTPAVPAPAVPPVAASATAAPAVLPPTAPPARVPATSPPPLTADRSRLIERTGVALDREVADVSTVDAFAGRTAGRVRPAPPPLPRAAVDFAAESFLKPAAMPPAAGWRRVVWQATGHRYLPPLSRAEQRRQEVTLRARAPVDSPTVIASAAGKGGVGKTTVALGAAVAAALVRADRLAVIDANPDAGSLASRVTPQPPPATIADLLDSGTSITRAAEAWRYLIQHPSRLDVLAAPLDPAVTRALGETEYSRALEVLTRFYSIIYADLGTALLGPATSYFLRRRADQVILVSAPSLDAGRIAGFTLDHLVVARGAEWCRRHVIVVVNAVRNDTLVDVRRLEDFFAPHVRATCRVAWDRHLAAGGTLNWDLLDSRTRDGYLELAALIADGFTDGWRGSREGADQ